MIVHNTDCTCEVCENQRRAKGRKDDQEKPMVDLIVPEFTLEVAKVMTKGAKKYGLENWKNSLEPRRILAALYRHTLAYHSGEKIDPESGLHHMAHVTANAMFLFYYDEVAGKKDGNKNIHTP